MSRMRIVPIKYYGIEKDKKKGFWKKAQSTEYKKNKLKINVKKSPFCPFWTLLKMTKEITAAFGLANITPT